MVVKGEVYTVDSGMRDVGNKTGWAVWGRWYAVD
jgi:hypothetical protein